MITINFIFSMYYIKSESRIFYKAFTHLPKANFFVKIGFNFAYLLCNSMKLFKKNPHIRSRDIRSFNHGL